MSNSFKKFNNWINNIKSKKVLKELSKINDAEIENCFGSSLDFGTAGMRGVMGMGQSKINEVMIVKLAFAVAEYINKNLSLKSVVIGFDTRNNSKLFSRYFAKVTSNMGIKTYLYKNFCPTPVLVHSITKLSAGMGVMITASHNSKVYNGIKISNSDGIQISGKAQADISKLFNKLDEVSLFNVFYNKKLSKNVQIINREIVDDYLTYNLPDTVKNKKTIKVVYTSLHGTGLYSVSKLLKQNGYKVYYPKKQIVASGEFKTCSYPNPEFEHAFNYSKQVATKIDADIILATDPDADRLGAMVKSPNGYYKLSGNEVGYILLDDLANQHNKKNAFAVTSVVTSPLFDDICKHYKIKGIKALTGFKNLGLAMQQEIKKHGSKSMVLSYEESCGYIVRDDILDKDGIFAALKLCNIAQRCKDNNSSVYEYLQDIYKQFGFMCSLSDSIAFEGNNATQRMNNAVNQLRTNPPVKIAGEKITKITDYENDNTGLEKQNFLEYKSKNHTLIVRPSGTEPKLKFYVYSKADNMKEAQENAGLILKEIKQKI